MDLSKAQDCLKDDLLLPNLQAYCFTKESIRLFLSYLTNGTQIIKIGSTFSDWINIVKGFPQGYILAPLLFNIFYQLFVIFLSKM